VAAKQARHAAGETRTVYDCQVPVQARGSRDTALRHESELWSGSGNWLQREPVAIRIARVAGAKLRVTLPHRTNRW